LIIAIDDYPDTVPEKLLGAVNDGKAMIDHLERILGVPSSQITTLFNDQATRVGILHALRALAYDDRIKSGDPIIIYYAGYGSTEPTPDGSDQESSVNQMIIPQNYGKDVHGIRDRTIARLIDLIAEKKGDNIVCSILFGI
jgi:methylaspartate ammonia-lyase